MLEDLILMDQHPDSEAPTYTYVTYTYLYRKDLYRNKQKEIYSYINQQNCKTAAMTTYQSQFHLEATPTILFLTL